MKIELDDDVVKMLTKLKEYNKKPIKDTVNESLRNQYGYWIEPEKVLVKCQYCDMYRVLGDNPKNCHRCGRIFGRQTKGITHDEWSKKVNS